MSSPARSPRTERAFHDEDADSSSPRIRAQAGNTRALPTAEMGLPAECRGISARTRADGRFLPCRW